MFSSAVLRHYDSKIIPKSLILFTHFKSISGHIVSVENAWIPIHILLAFATFGVSPENFTNQPNSSKTVTQNFTLYRPERRWCHLHIVLLSRRLRLTLFFVCYHSVESDLREFPHLCMTNKIRKGDLPVCIPSLDVSHP